MHIASIQRQIVVLGGGGFSEEPRNRLLDDYILGLTLRRRPRVCFVPTASGDSPDYVKRFYRAFPPRRAKASHLPLFVRDGREPRVVLLNAAARAGLSRHMRARPGRRNARDRPIPGRLSYDVVAAGEAPRAA